MNNLLLYCGLVDARISASEKDLHVKNSSEFSWILHTYFENIKPMIPYDLYICAIFVAKPKELKRKPPYQN